MGMIKIIKDVDPRRDDDASRCRHFKTYLNDFRLWHKSKFNFDLKKKKNQTKYKSKFNFDLKKNQIFMFPCCSTREDLSIGVSITIVGLILRVCY